MSDFLEFLNTADVEALKSLPGMNSSLAERIVASRPFETPEASLKVRGMGEKLLARLQAAFAEQISAEPAPSPEAEYPLAETPSSFPEPEPPAPEEPAQLPERTSAMTNPPPASPHPGFWAQLGRAFVGFLRFLLTLFIIFVIVAGIGAAVYFGLPYLNERYVVPVEQNTAHISELSTQQADDVKQLKEQIASLQKQLDEAKSRAEGLDKTITAQAETLAKLEQVQSRLDEAAAKQRDGILVELRHQIMFTRAIETLSRGRLFLSQSNFGLAKQDVQAARNLLAELQADVPDYQAQALGPILVRLDMALGNLPDFPVIAVDDVDIAWNLLIAGLPESAEAAAATPTMTLPLETPAATPTQTLPPGTATTTPTLTLTPEASLTPGPTPTPTP